MPFIHDDFILSNQTARRLYHDFAKDEPILDYHCHLPPEDIAADRQFANLYEIWLEGDHYKWRAMRANGTPENLVTGDASPFEKFQAWAATVPHTLRNPLYHWTHLELKRYFDIDDLLSPETAQSIWDRANEMLASPEYSARCLIAKFKVRAIGTTDDPTDDLAHHRAIAESGFETKVLPAFRPDTALKVDRPEIFNLWVDKLAVASNTEINSYASLVSALENRHAFFHSMGSRISDHGLDRAYAEYIPEEEAEKIFAAVRSGKAANPMQTAGFISNLMFLFGVFDAEKGWTK